MLKQLNIKFIFICCINIIILYISSFTLSLKMISGLSFSLRTKNNVRLFITLSKDPSNWNNHNLHMKKVGELKITSFNLLAPCYKRIQGRFGQFGLIRESADNELWEKRLEESAQFFKSEILKNSDIIAFQEFWLHEDYKTKFEELASDMEFEMVLLKRHPKRKADALVMVIDKKSLQIRGQERIELCSVSDRIAQILWLYHIESKKHLIVANTHLSFPHNEFDRINQIDQIKKLTSAIALFANKNNLTNATKIITGDLNVESSSDVCDHLRYSGYYSSLDICPPINGAVPPPGGFPLYHRSYFVSHRTHRNEDLGVDHVFFKPEIIKSNGFDIVSRGSETYQISRSDQILFVDETKILPIELSCTKWIENFSLSDHRPVNVKFIFGENLKKL